MTRSPFGKTVLAGYSGVFLCMLQACTSVQSRAMDGFARKHTTVSEEKFGEQAQQANSFVESVGVATHLSYDNTPYYTRWPEVLGKLQSLGVRHIRDGYYDWPLSSPFLAEHRSLAGAGIKTTYVVPLNPKTTPQSIAKFSLWVHDMEALEGANECDAKPNCGGGGTLGVRNMVAFAPTLHEAGQLAHVPVLGPSFTIASSFQEAGNIAANMDYNTLHVYFGGRHPGSEGWGGGDTAGHRYGSLKWWMDQGQIDAPGVPFVITETGYITKAHPTPYTIPESVAATYIPRSLLLAFNNGIKRTFIYELLDEFTSDPYGLLHDDLSEKPAFTAVKHLLELLSDPGPAFATGKLNYTITGSDDSVVHTLLQRRDGSFWLILWLEQSSWDPQRNTPVPVNPRPLVLHLNGKTTVKEIVQFDVQGEVTRRAIKESDASFPSTVTENLTAFHIVPSETSRQPR